MDKQKVAKPSFRETVTVTTMDLDDVGLTFNAKRIGPMNFAGLREADYGEGFRMPTMPEIVPLVYASLENKNYDTAKNVVKTLKNHWITEDTAIHYFLEGMYVQDNPAIKNGRIITPTQKELENRLGSHKEKKVVFSDDRSVRVTPYNFKRGFQTPSELSTNTGIIALVGGEENAEKLAKASKHYKSNPYFWTLEKVDSPQTRIVGLYSGGFDAGLGVVADYSEDLDHMFSFGVLESGAEKASPLEILNPTE